MEVMEAVVQIVPHRVVRVAQQAVGMVVVIPTVVIMARADRPTRAAMELLPPELLPEPKSQVVEPVLEEVVVDSVAVAEEAAQVVLQPAPAVQVVQTDLTTATIQV